MLRRMSLRPRSRSGFTRFGEYESLVAPMPKTSGYERFLGGIGVVTGSCAVCATGGYARGRVVTASAR